MESYRVRRCWGWAGLVLVAWMLAGWIGEVVVTLLGEAMR